MALEHVAQHAGRIVVARPMADGERFGGGDLDMLDVIAVPDRLEDRIGEPQDQDVLHRFLAQVVIDPVDLALGENLVNLAVELLGAGQVRAEGLFHHDAPGAVRFAGQSGSAQVHHGRCVELRRDGQVVHPRRGPTAFDFLQETGQCLEVVGANQRSPGNRKCAEPARSTWRRRTARPGSARSIPPDRWRHASCENAVRAKPTICVSGGKRFFWCKE